ncbi:MAG: hypothetical protein EA366_01325, partial [Spirulina sp. DLM2.Bin59]
MPQNSAPPPPTPPPEESSADTEEFDLPEPDPENITVLSKSLPNKPILPWNRYDSPWKEGDGPPPEELPAAESEGETGADQDVAEEPEP